MSAATFASRSTISSTATVKSGTAEISGATVTFILTKSDGSTGFGTATTNSSGQAAWSYKLGPKDPSGTYSMKAIAVHGAQTATSAATTFIVQ
jgi:hypothetical protein